MIYRKSCCTTPNVSIGSGRVSKKFYIKILCDGQGAVRQAILYVDRCCQFTGQFNRITLFNCRTGASCSKRMTLLVNVLLKFQTLISEIRQYFLIEKNVRSFCSAKASLIFSAKNISVYGYKGIKHLKS